MPCNLLKGMVRWYAVAPEQNGYRRRGAWFCTTSSLVRHLGLRGTHQTSPKTTYGFTPLWLRSSQKTSPNSAHGTLVTLYYILLSDSYGGSHCKREACGLLPHCSHESPSITTVVVRYLPAFILPRVLAIPLLRLVRLLRKLLPGRHHPRILSKLLRQVLMLQKLLLPCGVRLAGMRTGL